VKNDVKTIHPTDSPLEKPAKQRILEASDKLFRRFGIRVGIGSIAHEAHSNVDTVGKHFGSRERLVSQFVKSLIEDSEKQWREAADIYPNDPESGLRYWIFSEGFDESELPHRLETMKGSALLRSLLLWRWSPALPGEFHCYLNSDIVR